MVKVDAKHDYYADLELPSTCSVEDIRKQYRKLALLYHPDRNAGKEEEFVPKFQAIQTAHEVLGDATVKRQYDTDRQSARHFSSSRTKTSTPGNPYTASSAFPPPPRRTQPGTWQRPPRSANNTPSGADRFSEFGRDAPTARKDPVRDRANIFKAWQNMPNGGKPADDAFANNRRPPAPPPRPGPSPTTANSTKEGSKYHRVPPQYKPDQAEANKSAWESFNNTKSKNGADRPNASRTSSFQTPRRGGFDPSTPGSDERPAGSYGYGPTPREDDTRAQTPPSHKYVPPPPRRPARSAHSPLPPKTPEESTQHPPPPFVDPLKPFRSKSHADDIPFSEANRFRTPYSSYIGEKTSFSSETLRRSASTRDTTSVNRPTVPTAERARSSSPARSTGPGSAAKPPIVDYSSTDPSEAESGSEGEQQPARDPADRPKKIPKRPSVRLQRASTTKGQSSGGQPENGTARPPMPAMRERPGSSIFSIPITADTFAPNGSAARSRSEDNIDTNFSPTAWKGAFTGTDRGLADDFSTAENVDPQDSLRPASAPRAASFNQKTWDQTFQDDSWARIPPIRTASPTKLGQNRAKSFSRKGSTKSSLAASTTASRQTAGETFSSVTPPLGAEDAMDIDSMNPPQAVPRSAETFDGASQEPRLYSVPPSPWRQQQDPEQAKSPVPFPARKQVPLESNLDDLRHVAPLASTNDDPLDLADIGATLPFQSQASAETPLQAHAPQKLQLPTFPTPPIAPTHITRQSWRDYVQEFGRYVQAYHVFDSLLMQHFIARERQVQKLTSNGFGWLEAVGDTNGGGSSLSGYGGYLKSMHEDAPVREAWSLGAQRHAKEAEAFEKMRAQVKRLASGGMLPLA